MIYIDLFYLSQTGQHPVTARRQSDSTSHSVGAAHA